MIVVGLMCGEETSACFDLGPNDTAFTRSEYCSFLYKLCPQLLPLRDGSAIQNCECLLMLDL